MIDCICIAVTSCIQYRSKDIRMVLYDWKAQTQSSVCCCIHVFITQCGVVQHASPSLLPGTYTYISHSEVESMATCLLSRHLSNTFI